MIELVAPVLISLQPMDPGDWPAALAPPYEVVDVSAPVDYVPDSDADHKRPYRTAIEGGDCEDWAIAAYHARAAVGVPVEDMAIIIGWEPAANGWHAVLLTDGVFIDPTGAMSLWFQPRYEVTATGAFEVMVP